MTMLCFWFIFLFDWPVAMCDRKTASSGSYKSGLVSARDCETPSRPYVKDSPITFKATVHNTSGIILLDGNVTVSKDTKNTKIRLKSMVRKNDRWRVSYLINDIGCHSILQQLISTAAGMKYDRKTCTIFKGQYNFKNIEVNSIQHLWSSKSEYGEISWRAEIFSHQVGTFFCNEFDTITEPA